MAFTEEEIARYGALIEEVLWSKRRPPLHLRDKVREGQRIAGQEVELYLVRPFYRDPRKQVEESIAKTRYVKSRDVWRVFWKRADGKWHRYDPMPEVASLKEFLELVDEDKFCCFWG